MTRTRTTLILGRVAVPVALAAALMAAITVFGSASAFAQEAVCTEEPPSGPGGMGEWTVTCVETEVVTEEVSRTPTTQECVVANSDRQGTQKGDLVQTDEVTYETTTTTKYQGHPSNGNAVSQTTSDPVEVERVEGTPTFEPTGPCRSIPGRQ